VSPELNTDASKARGWSDNAALFSRRVQEVTSSQTYRLTAAQRIRFWRLSWLDGSIHHSALTMIQRPCFSFIRCPNSRTLSAERAGVGWGNVT